MTSRFSALRPGPTLAKRLAAVELGSLPDEQLLDYLQAEVRQLSSQQARVWAAMAEVARRVPSQAFEPNSGWTSERVLDSAVLEIATELRVSRVHADHELDHARAVEAMPSVAAALRAGELDRNRVLVLLDVCRDLPNEQHRDAVITQVLPDAGRMPAAKLRVKAQRIAIALDPDWAERRYRQALKCQRVVRYINADGTVTLAAEDQDAAEALAAYARLTALARAAKRAGAHATLDTLRSDLTLGLLGPRFAGLRDTDLITYLVGKYPRTAPEPMEDPAPGDEPTDEPIDEPTDDQPTGQATDEEPVAPVESEATADEPAAEAPAVDEPPTPCNARTAGEIANEVAELFWDEEWLERFWYGELAEDAPPRPDPSITRPLPRKVRPLRPPPLPPTGTDPPPF